MGNPKDLVRIHGINQAAISGVASINGFCRYVDRKWMFRMIGDQVGSAGIWGRGNDGGAINSFTTGTICGTCPTIAAYINISTSITEARIGGGSASVEITASALGFSDC